MSCIETPQVRSPTPNCGRRFAPGRSLAWAAVDVIAPSKARRLLPGESPGRVRASHQPFQGDYSRGVFPLSNFAVET
jgi:hypothetical protein